MKEILFHAIFVIVIKISIVPEKKCVIIFEKITARSSSILSWNDMSWSYNMAIFQDILL